ncbi:MAG: hypothetical protein SOX72_02685, partial [Oscillospiraceae bacterium]|nr:hypothetical protein [Oscillospiraceae bacterium]
MKSITIFTGICALAVFVSSLCGGAFIPHPRLLPEALSRGVRHAAGNHFIKGVYHMKVGIQLYSVKQHLMKDGL